MKSRRRLARSASPALRLAAAVALSFALALGSAPTAPAQGLFGAVAKVNDDVVTGFDLRQRASLLRFAAGRDVPDAEAQALDVLVTDALKLQEAKRLGVEVSDADVLGSLDLIARNNRTSVDALVAAMAQAGVERGTLERQIRADLAWRALIQRRFGDRLRPTDGEIDAAVSGTAEGPKVYDIKQIVVELAPNAPDSAARAAFEEAERVRAKLKECGQVAELAKGYARISGDVGKMPAERMPPPVREAVLTMSVGETAKPMRSQNGVHVIMLCGVEQGGGDRRAVAEKLADDKGRRFAESYLAELRRDALIESRQ